MVLLSRQPAPSWPSSSSPMRNICRETRGLNHPTSCLKTWHLSALSILCVAHWPNLPFLQHIIVELENFQYVWSLKDFVNMNFVCPFPSLYSYSLHQISFRPWQTSSLWGSVPLMVPFKLLGSTAGWGAVSVTVIIRQVCVALQTIQAS